MTHLKKNLFISFCLMISLGYHTATQAFLKDLKFWKKGKEETLSLSEAVSEKCNISITNLKGNINVKTWEKSKVVIEVKKEGSQEALDATTVIKKFAHNKLKIETISKDPKAKSTVHYDILIPSSARLQSVTTDRGSITIANISHGAMAKTEKGTITFENVKGPIKASTNRGSINIDAAELIPEHKILAFSAKGNIKLSMPQGSDADVFFKTTRGSINSDIEITTQPRTMKFNSKTLAQLKRQASGTIGRGGSPIKLHTGSGNISVISS